MKKFSYTVQDAAGIHARPAGLLVKLAMKATDKSDMYSREFPNGNFLFFVVCMMSLFRLPQGRCAFAQQKDDLFLLQCFARFAYNRAE